MNNQWNKDIHDRMKDFPKKATSKRTRYGLLSIRLENVAPNKKMYGQ